MAGMFYVYTLKSKKNQDIYIGYSTDLKKRYKAHNQGGVSATKPNRPWELVYYEAYKDKRDATKREKQLKNHAAKNDLKRQLYYSISGLAEPGLASQGAVVK